jgi:hypothetical protein
LDLICEKCVEKIDEKIERKCENCVNGVIKRKNEIKKSENFIGNVLDWICIYLGQFWLQKLKKILLQE